MATQSSKGFWTVPRFGVLLAITVGLALGAVLSERTEERTATRIEERAAVKAIVQPEPGQSRCASLGAGCICNETLDFYYNNGNPYGDINPPNDAETVECADGNIVMQGAGAYSSIAASAIGVPSDATVSYVQRKTNSINIAWIYGNNQSVPLSKTHCHRMYHRFDANFSTSDPLQRIKVSDWRPFTNVDYVQTKFPGGNCTGGDSSCPFQATSLYASNDENFLTTNLIYLDDCAANWCRVEHCDDVAANGAVTSRVRITVIGGASQTGVATTTAAGYGPITNWSTPGIGDLYTRSVSGGKYRYMAQAIQTMVDVDQTFWPGCEPAFEGQTLCPTAGGD